MTSMHKHTFYGAKALQDQFLNSICGNHDLMCSCDDPLKHTCLLILQKAKPTFTDDQKKIIKKCLGEEDGDGDPATTALDIDAGDLEKLFAEDTTNDG